MADEQEQREAQNRHGESMRRLQNLRDDVRGELTAIIDRYFDRRMDDAAEERAERGYLRDELAGVARRIDQTINSL